MASKKSQSRLKISPAYCTFDELCKIPRDNSNIGDFSIMTDGYRVWLSEQVIGEAPKQHIELKRSTFNRLITWYLGSYKPVRK